MVFFPIIGSFQLLFLRYFLKFSFFAFFFDTYDSKDGFLTLSQMSLILSSISLILLFSFDDILSSSSTYFISFASSYSTFVLSSMLLDSLLVSIHISWFFSISSVTSASRFIAFDFVLAPHKWQVTRILHPGIPEERWVGCHFLSNVHGSESLVKSLVMFDFSWLTWIRSSLGSPPMIFWQDADGCHRRLLNISCIFSTLVSSLFICILFCSSLLIILLSYSELF